MTLSDKSDYDKNPTSSKADDGDTHALICDMSFGVALTFGVTSAVLFLTKDEPPPATASNASPEAKAAANARRNRVTFTPDPRGLRALRWRGLHPPLLRLATRECREYA